MIQRCTNHNHPKYPIYGGRGIVLSPEWRSFDNFLRDMGVRPEGMTLDRIDNDGPYCLANCRWATRKEQQNNQSTTQRVTYCGQETTLSLLADKMGLGKGTLKYRIGAGWPQERWGDAAWGGNRAS